MRVKKEITEFGNKLFIKVNLLEFNREKYNLKYNYNIYKIKTLTIKYCKYSSKNTNKILNYKPAYT